MGSQDKNEMEEIQRGLEAFLEKELDVIGSSRRPGRSDASGHRSDRREELLREEEHFREDWRFQEADPYPEEEPDPYQNEPGFYREDLNLYQEERKREAPVLDMIGGGQSMERPRRAEYEQRTEESRRNGYSREGERIRRGGEQETYRPEREKQGRTEAQYQAEDYSYRQTRNRREGRYSQQEGLERRKRPREKAQRDQKEESPMRKKGQEIQKSSRKKGRRKKHRLRKFLIIAALIFGLIGFGWYQLVGMIYGKMIFHQIDSVADAPLKEEGVVNILLIGNDSRLNGEDGRSDAMILLSISSRTKKIYMTSLLRDIYVEIPGYQGNRLNAAYSFGGAELLMETIEKNFDIPVNRYILVNFEAFANLVDAVDGIELELSTEEIEYVNGYLMEYNALTGRPQGTDDMDPSQPGLVHLNGPQALAYCRNRYLGTDFGRTERQRKVLTAVIGKLPSNILTGAGDLINGLMPNLTTNLTRNECFRLSLMAGKLFTYEMVPDSIPQPGTYWNEDIRGMQVLGVDFDSNIRYLKEKLYGE